METVLSRTFTAAADYSSTGQYRFVYLSAANTVTLCSEGTQPIGILQNAPASGEDAEVMLYGVSRLSIYGTAAVMDSLESYDNGQGQTTTTDNDYVGALVLEAAVTTGDVVKVLLTPGCMYANS